MQQSQLQHSCVAKLLGLAFYCQPFYPNYYMNTIRAIYKCKILKSESSYGLIMGIISAVSMAILYIVTGGFCGIIIEEGFFSLDVMESIILCICMLIILLKEKDYSFVRPICPYVSRHYLAFYRITESIISVDNIILVCLFIPLFRVLNQTAISFEFVFCVILSNLLISQICLIANITIFRKFKISRLITIISISGICFFLVIFRTTEIAVFNFFLQEGSIFFVLFILWVILLAISYVLLKNDYPEVYHFGLKIKESSYSAGSGNIKKAYLFVLIRQYLRCPAYRKIYPSLFALIILGAFLCKTDGCEYVGAMFFIGSYTFTMLQYSTSFMSRTPDLFFSSPVSAKNLIYPFLIVNFALTTALSVIISAFLKIKSGCSVLPILVIWGAICGPLSKMILLTSIFPIKIDLWVKDPSLGRTPVQVFVTLVSFFVVLLSALLLQFKTIETSSILGIISILSLLTYKKYISFLDSKISERKYIIMNSLR